MRLSRLDLPALGGPAIATVSPSRRRSPRRSSASAARDLVAQRARGRERRPDQVLRHVGLVREVDPRLDQRQRLDQPRAPHLRLSRQASVELAKRLAALRLGLRIDEVGKSLDGGQVDAAVREGAARELARLRQTEARRGRRAPPARPRPRRGRRAAAARPCPRRSRFRGPGNQSTRPESIASPVGRIAHLAQTRRGAAQARARPSFRGRIRARGPEIRTTAMAAGSRPGRQRKYRVRITAYYEYIFISCS